jgi:hypothetical protein
VRLARLISGEDLIAQIDALVADIHAGTGNEPFDPLLALSAKRAGEISFASFAAALLSGTGITVESLLNGGGAHAEVAEHTPGTRTRIERQRGEEVLGAHLGAPGLLCNRGRTLHRLTGLGRLLWRPPAGQASSSGEQLSRGGAHRVSPHSQLLQNGGGYPLVEKPDQLVMGAHRPAASRQPPPGALNLQVHAFGARGRGSPKRCLAACLDTPIRWPISVQEHPARRASPTNWPISSSAHEASSSLTVSAASTRSSGAPGVCWRTASTSSATLTASTSTT